MREMRRSRLRESRDASAVEASKDGLGGVCSVSVLLAR